MTHKRASRNAGPQGVQLGLIITPMLDMSFQLLAFFIMTYHPSALEAHIPGSLAQPDQTAERNPKEPALPVPQPALSADPEPYDGNVATVRIKAVPQGREPGNRVGGVPRQVFLRLPLESEDRLIADVGVDFDAALKRLNAELKELVNSEAIGKANLKIAADGDLRQQYVMQVYDTCKKAGFDRIHFVPPPVLNTKISTR